MRDRCPCYTHGRCEVYRRLLRGEVNSGEYVKHVRRVVDVQMRAWRWYTMRRKEAA